MSGAERRAGEHDFMLLYEASLRPGGLENDSVLTLVWNDSVQELHAL